MAYPIFISGEALPETDKDRRACISPGAEAAERSLFSHAVVPCYIGALM